MTALNSSEACENCPPSRTDHAWGSDGMWSNLRRYLHRIVRKRSGWLGAEDASDVVQQTLLEAHRNKSRASAQQDLVPRRGWLRRILQCNLADVARDAHREKRDVRRTVALDRFAGDDSGNAILATITACDTTPSEAAMRAEQRDLILGALDQLSTDQRRVIELRFFESRRIPEIAAQLGRSEAAVAGLLFRGLRRLRRELPEC